MLAAFWLLSLDGLSTFFFLSISKLSILFFSLHLGNLLLPVAQQQPLGSAGEGTRP